MENNPTGKDDQKATNEQYDGKSMAGKHDQKVTNVQYGGQSITGKDDQQAAYKQNNGEGTAEKEKMEELFSIAFSSQKLLVWIKSILRLEAIMILFFVLIYFISGIFIWRINGSGARQLVQITTNLLNSSENSKVDRIKLQQLNDILDLRLSKLKYQGLSISNFYVSSSEHGDGSANPIVTTGPNKRDSLQGSYQLGVGIQIPVKVLSRLEQEYAWTKTSLIEKITSTVGEENFNNYNLDQFIRRGSLSDPFHIKLLLFLSFLSALTLITYCVNYYLVIVSENEAQEKQTKLQAKAQESQQALLVWDLAQKKLNKYYDRNLNQNNYIFIVSVVVMIAGFGLVLYGIALHLQNEKDTFGTLVSAGSGTIVQFIGATFLVIYNTTVKQAITYTNSLQKISTIGTSIKILDAIKLTETNPAFQANNDKLIQARIDIAKMLIDAKIWGAMPEDPKI